MAELPQFPQSRNSARTVEHSGLTIELGCGPGRHAPEWAVGKRFADQRQCRAGRILGRAVELLGRGGRCVAEFDAEAIAVRDNWIRLESARQLGPRFRWASVGLDSAAMLASQVGLTMTGIHPIGERVVASLAVSRMPFLGS